MDVGNTFSLQSMDGRESPAVLKSLTDMTMQRVAALCEMRTTRQVAALSPVVFSASALVMAAGFMGRLVIRTPTAS